jgi:hypothetical protein
LELFPLPIGKGEDGDKTWTHWYTTRELLRMSSLKKGAAGVIAE